jgi:hypothetical protein
MAVAHAADHDVAVVGLLGQQVLVRALGHHATAGDKYDVVGVVEPQGGHRGHDRGLPSAVVREPLSDPRLGVGVDGGRGLDQYEDPRACRERARQDDSLALAT